MEGHGGLVAIYFEDLRQYMNFVTGSSRICLGLDILKASYSIAMFAIHSCKSYKNI